MRITVDGVVEVRLNAHTFKTMLKLISSMLACIVGDDYRANHEVALHELVAQSEHVFVVRDAQVGTYLVLLNVGRTDYNDNLN